MPRENLETIIFDASHYKDKLEKALKRIKKYLKKIEDLESRTCENCKHCSGNVETPSKNICEQLEVPNLEGNK